MTRLRRTWPLALSSTRVAALALGLLGSVLVVAGAGTLAAAFAPNAGMAAMGIFFAPWLLFGGAVGLVSAYQVWHGRQAGRLAGVFFSLILGAIATSWGLNALRLFQPTPSDQPCIGKFGGACVSSPADAAPPGPDLAVAIPLLVIAALCLVVVLLLILAWGAGTPGLADGGD